jgi:hypothetical protein
MTLLTRDQFLTDVAAVYREGTFGSGRLIARDLVLTAGHLVDHAEPAGWKVVLIGERQKDGSWTSAHNAEVIWRGTEKLDMALLRLTDKNGIEPGLPLQFVSYNSIDPIADVYASGFPEFWGKGSASDYTVHGSLRITDASGLYVFIVPGADRPDEPTGWKGMGGAVVCRIDTEILSLFGVISAVPNHFAGGILEVTSISEALQDEAFRTHLQLALQDVHVIDYAVPKQGIERTPSKQGTRLVRLFISYKHGDHLLVSQLKNHLGWLENNNQIEIFDDTKVALGEDWSKRIIQEIRRANIIIFLVSGSFMGSAYCTQIELREALSLVSSRGTIIVPVLVEDCDWEAMPIRIYAALPRDKNNNLKSLKRWRRDVDVALAQIAKQVRLYVESLTIV